MAFRSSQSSARRADTFKAINTADDARRKREEQRVQIRKSARDESLKKKRNIDFSSAPEPELPITQQSNMPTKYNASTQQKLQELPNWVGYVRSSDVNLQIEGTQQIRKMLSVEKNPPIAEVIATGVIDQLVPLLACIQYPRLQFEAAWALTNIASGTSDQTEAVVRANAVPYFVELLKSSEPDVREQSVWALGNIAGESTDYRDYVLSSGGMHNTLLSLNATLQMEAPPMGLIKNTAWTISNLCRGKPEPKFEYVKDALIALNRLIQFRDDDVLTDSCWALSYLTDGENDKIQAALDAGVGPRLIELLMHTSYSVKTPVLRVVGNLVTGDDSQTQRMLEYGLLPSFLALMNSSKKSIRKECCWAISNITAGTKAQIQSIFDADLFPSLVRLLGDADFDTKKEACWAVTNATSGGSKQQISYMVKQGVLKPLCKLLKVSDTKLLGVALDAVENILKNESGASSVSGKHQASYAELIEEAGGLDNIEELQSHENVNIYEKAVALLEKYFSAETANDAENAFQPAIVNQQPTTAGAQPQQAFTFNWSAPAAVPAGGFEFKF